MIDDSAHGQEADKRLITMGYLQGSFGAETVDEIVTNLSRYATASAYPYQQFSETATALRVVLEMLLSTLTGIGSNAIYEAIRPAIDAASKSSKELSLRVRATKVESDGSRRIFELSVDTNNPQKLERAVSSVSNFFSEHGWLFAYDDEAETWKEVSPDADTRR